MTIIIDYFSYYVVLSQGLHDSTSCIIHNTLQEKIEKMSETIYLITVKVTAPATMLPALMVFAIDYFTDNLTEKSFTLPFPVM